MILIVLATFLYSSYTFAVDGTVNVLRAPLFEKPNVHSKILTYKRKGHQIFIHDQEVFENIYQNEYIEDNKEPIDQKVLFPDKLLNEKTVYLPKVHSNFYKTVVNSGKEAYILKKHVFIDYKDTREMEQNLTHKDDTDYRIREPLPKNYPFIKEIKKRGQLFYSAGQPNFKFYVPKDKIMDSTLELTKELTIMWSKAALIIPSKRFYFGFQAGIYTAKNKLLGQSHTSVQENDRISIGPYASYDLYQTSQINFNVYTSFQFVLLDQMHFAITNSLSSIEEKRSYSSLLSIAPNIGFKIHLLNIFLNTDFVLGTNVRILLPKTYKALGRGIDATFWDSNSSNDQLKQSFRTEVSYLLGLQSQF